ncbi:hypothetical protein [Natrarchaeobaculum sulfurireducens]|uniref:hypothetical protein n=1 Tax=Natrarchaeobaculum sulfurireducens TaxID=2044521 RepID=UPI000E3CB790|nr:hypothetical protein [Natrarchaeobaculum sulfurireducens]
MGCALAEYRGTAGKPLTVDELQELAEQDYAYGWLLWKFRETPSTWAEKYPIEDRIMMEHWAREHLELVYGLGGEQR